MRVLVTRPQPQADEWVARLRAAGVDAQALPLLGIAPADDPAPVDTAWRSLAGDAAPALVMFVSPNAVASFFDRRPAGVDWPAATLAAAPGPGTAAALVARGVPAASVEQPAADAAQFDSEALWARLRLRDWHGASAWIVRGEGGRDWLAETLRAAGAAVRFVQAYRRGAPRLDASGRQRLAEALAAPREHLWLFSSSEAVGHLRALAPGAGWGAAQAFASHPRIAEAARALGVVAVHEVRPEFDAVLAALRRHGATIEP
jgi:uroporphyrinogen-III synthase